LLKRKFAQFFVPGNESFLFIFIRTCKEHPKILRFRAHHKIVEIDEEELLFFIRSIGHFPED